MTVLAYRLTVWVVSMNVESPRHHHRATLLQNRRSPVDARHLEAVVPVRPLSAFFLEWASAMPALMIEYQVDLRRRPNLSEMFQRREFRVLGQDFLHQRILQLAPRWRCDNRVLWEPRNHLVPNKH